LSRQWLGDGERPWSRKGELQDQPLGLFILRLQAEDFATGIARRNLIPQGVQRMRQLQPGVFAR